MKYVDTGSRDPSKALGSWLSEVLHGESPIIAARIQTGYFGADALGYCEVTLRALAASDGHTRLLIGSNDGQTSRASIAALLHIAGKPRSGLRVGIVSFQKGLFHPKVLHFRRADGSTTAYVGSANLTVPGASGLNVEAAMILDTAHGDPPTVLEEIADAVDAWFVENRPGLYPVTGEADLDLLVAANVLDVPPTPRVNRTVHPARGGGQQLPPGHALSQLLPVPAIQAPLATELQPASGRPATAVSPVGPHTAQGRELAPATLDRPTVVKRWFKLLHRSDVGRLGEGSNPQGAMTLTQGPRMTGYAQHPIDQGTYFRDDLFADARWELQPGEAREVAMISAEVVVYGESLGIYALQLRYSADLDAAQGNRTVLLHWGPDLNQYLRHERDHDGDVVTIEKFSDGSYRLSIEAEETGPFIA